MPEHFRFSSNSESALSSYSYAFRTENRCALFLECSKRAGPPFSRSPLGDGKYIVMRYKSTDVHCDLQDSVSALLVLDPEHGVAAKPLKILRDMREDREQRQ